LDKVPHSQDEYRLWYENNKQFYDELTVTVKESIEVYLNKEGLKQGSDYLLVDSRLKKYDRFMEKINRPDEEGKPKYSSPEQITDLAGIRIVGYILSDTTTICSLIERYFDIDENRTIRPTHRLKENQVGYRSTNYIATLREETLLKPEHKKFIRSFCEIQVKTLLDLAWSQIEHDRNYKIAEEFPKGTDIPRRFNLLSGLLEVADNEFEVLSKDVRKYDKTISEKIEKGELNLEVSAYSLRLYLNQFDDIPGFRPYFVGIDDIVGELNSMGINKLDQFHHIVPKDFKEKYAKVSEIMDYVTYSALIRDILIIHNHKEYFEKAWKHHFNTFDYHSAKVFDAFQVDTSNFPVDLVFDNPWY
jgi:putative GTP pyrophosphokinase